MKSKKVNHKKSAAQAMVEFAIALPILLMLAYGILETGRFLFLYSTVVTASRQAVRYGTATGSGTGTAHRYWDCDGIRQAANNAGYLGDFDFITIENDDGPGTTPNPYCIDPNNPIDDTFIPSTLNTDRLVVTVTEQFTPIVPNLVPFVTRAITATSARTILVSVNIAVTAPAGAGPGGGGDLSITISASPTTFTTLGETITYTYLVTNTATSGDINTPIVITGNIGSVSCAGEPSVLTPGASFTCSGTYQITQADLDLGQVDNNATATAGGSSDSDLETITATQSPALTLTKDSDIQASAIVNTVITYTYTLTNNGNVTLTSPYDINDSKINDSAISCPASGDIAPGSSIPCQGTYTIKNPDITAGTVTNTATATAYFGATLITSNPATKIVYTPAVYLTVNTSTPTVNAVGQVITYTYILKNNTANNIQAPYTVSDNRSPNEACVGTTSPMPSNGTSGTTCTGTYTVTQADLDTGSVLVSNVVATAIKSTNPAAGSTLTSNSVTVNVGVTQNPGLSLSLSANPTTATTLGDIVNYTYTLTNTGNVTLTTPSVTDDKLSNETCADTSPLAPGATRNCTGTYTITQADLDAGSVINQATASAILGASTVTSNPASATVTTYVGPRLTLVITSNPPSWTGSGQILTFTYTLKNTGSVVLASPYSGTSNIAGAGDCSAASATIPVGGNTACIGFYTTTATDLTNGSVTNTATATAMDGAATVTSNNASVTVPVTP